MRRRPSPKRSGDLRSRSAGRGERVPERGVGAQPLTQPGEQAGDPPGIGQSARRAVHSQIEPAVEGRKVRAALVQHGPRHDAGVDDQPPIQGEPHGAELGPQEPHGERRVVHHQVGLADPCHEEGRYLLEARHRGEHRRRDPGRPLGTGGYLAERIHQTMEGPVHPSTPHRQGGKLADTVASVRVEPGRLHIDHGQASHPQRAREVGSRRHAENR